MSARSGASPCPRSPSIAPRSPAPRTRPASRRAAAGPLEEGKAQTTAAYAGLDRTQSALADSIESVLNWGQGQTGKLGVKDGQLLFTSKEQQAQLQALLGKVQLAENAMNAEVAAMQKVQLEAQQKMRENNRQMREILAK